MTVWVPDDDGHADLSSHDSFLNGPPHNTFRRMRKEAPLEWTEWDHGKGFWSATRHSDILDLNRNYKLLTSARGIRMEDQTYEEYLSRRTFQETDPPEHTYTRMKVANAFSKRMVAEFEGQIRTLCEDILNSALPVREFDATAEIARKLPMRMLGKILGTPDEDLDWLVSKGDALIANTDPDYSDHVLDKMETDEFRMMPFNSPAGAELYVYAKELMDRKERERDTGGVLHMILQPGRDGSVISEAEFRNFFCLLVAAGNDTTRYSIAAAIHAFCHRPELIDELHAEGEGIGETAADELIRWASPTMYFRRTATEDFEMHGKSIRKGDKILLWFVSGNRDEDAFENPFQIDLKRHPNRHVAFGQGGPHVCLGMWLARLELRVLLTELVKRVRRIEATAPPKFLRSNFIGGLKSLPIQVEMR